MLSFAEPGFLCFLRIKIRILLRPVLFVDAGAVHN